MTPRTPTPVLIEAMLAIGRGTSRCGRASKHQTIREAATRLSELYVMVGRTHAIVRARQKIEHLGEDRLRPSKRPIDDLLAQFDRELAK